MEIALLIAEPNVSRPAVDQQDFILDEVPVLLYGCSLGKLLRTRHKVLRAVVFRANLQHELGRCNGTLVNVNAASPQFPFIPLQQKRLGICL